MTDKEMLELAAKAAGYKYFHEGYDDYLNFPCIEEDGFPVKWEPLTDGDALLKLAAKLRISICFSNPEEEDETYSWGSSPCGIELDDDCYHRLVLRIAAKMGEKCEQTKRKN